MVAAILKLDPNDVLQDHCLSNNDCNPVIKTGLNNRKKTPCFKMNRKKRANIGKERPNQMTQNE